MYCNPTSEGIDPPLHLINCLTRKQIWKRWVREKWWRWEKKFLRRIGKSVSLWRKTFSLKTFFIGLFSLQSPVVRKGKKYGLKSIKRIQDHQNFWSVLFRKLFRIQRINWSGGFDPKEERKSPSFDPEITVILFFFSLSLPLRLDWHARELSDPYDNLL